MDLNKSLISNSIGSIGNIDDDQKTQSNKIKIAFVHSAENSDLNLTTDIGDSLELELEDVWANKSQISNWTGPIPISEYPINVDPNPIIIKKELRKVFECRRKLFIKYLEPKFELGKPGSIVVNQESGIRY